MPIVLTGPPRNGNENVVSVWLLTVSSPASRLTPKSRSKHGTCAEAAETMAASARTVPAELELDMGSGGVRGQQGRIAASRPRRAEVGRGSWWRRRSELDLVVTDPLGLPPRQPEPAAVVGAEHADHHLVAFLGDVAGMADRLV